MKCPYGVSSILEPKAAKAEAAFEQLRITPNQFSCPELPHAEPCRQTKSILLNKVPFDCRLLIWNYVLRTDYTRIERWWPSHYGMSNITREVEAFDARRFPYRLSTPDKEMHEGKKKDEKPLAMLLSCRQLYSEAVDVLYSSTTLVFANPEDVHCFQVTASLQALARVKGLIITFGKVDWPENGPFHHEEGLQDWELALHGLKKMPSLREIEIWFYHDEFDKAKEHVWARRPWTEQMESEAAERQHQKLFDLFGNVDVPGFTINLSWEPEDIFSQRAWPFKVNVQTDDEIYRGMMKFPYPVEPNMYE